MGIDPVLRQLRDVDERYVDSHPLDHARDNVCHPVAVAALTAAPSHSPL